MIGMETVEIVDLFSWMRCGSIRRLKMRSGKKGFHLRSRWMIAMSLLICILNSLMAKAYLVVERKIQGHYSTTIAVPQ